MNKQTNKHIKTTTSTFKGHLSIPGLCVQQEETEVRGGGGGGSEKRGNKKRKERNNHRENISHFQRVCLLPFHSSAPAVSSTTTRKHNHSSLDIATVSALASCLVVRVLRQVKAITASDVEVCQCSVLYRVCYSADFDVQLSL